MSSAASGSADTLATAMQAAMESITASVKSRWQRNENPSVREFMMLYWRQLVVLHSIVACRHAAWVANPHDRLNNDRW